MLTFIATVIDLRLGTISRQPMDHFLLLRVVNLVHDLCRFRQLRWFDRVPFHPRSLRELYQSLHEYDDLDPKRI